MNLYSVTVDTAKRCTEGKKREKMAKIDTFLIDGARVKTIVLDMNSTEDVTTDFKFKQYDYGTCFISAQLKDKSTPLDLSHYTIMGVFKDSAGNLIVDSQNNLVKSKARIAIVEEGVVKLIIPKDVLKKSGEINCEILLFKSDTRMTSPKFNFKIIESMFDHESAIAPSYSPICGEVLCGEAICGDITSSTEFVIESNLSEAFKKRFSK